MNKYMSIILSMLILTPVCMAMFNAPAPMSSIATYSNENRTGYMIMNIMTQHTATLYLVENKTVDVKVNAISSSDANVTINGQNFNLTIGNQKEFLDPPLFTFHAVLTSINNTSAVPTITLIIYAQPILPRHSAHGLTIEPENTTTIPTTTVPVVNTTISVTTTLPVNETTGSPSGNPIPPILPMGISAMIAIIVGYYALTAKKPTKRRKR
jgi:hypothetical protein